MKLQVDVPHRGDSKCCSGQHKPMYSGSHFEETTSTLVPRVPNKSVEDLYCVESAIHPGSCSCDKCVESLGAYAGAAESERESSAVENSTFGVIKDLSVSNIHAFEDDKTRDFLAKDFASLFQKTQLRLAVGQAASRNGGKMFAANTPSDEDNMACVLVSPESEKSAMSLELWRPCTTVSALSDSSVSTQSHSTDHTNPEVESSGGKSYQNLTGDITDSISVKIHNIEIDFPGAEKSDSKTDDLLLENENEKCEEESEMEFGEEKTRSEVDESDMIAVTGIGNNRERFFEHSSSLLEMAENLVQMTEQLSSQIQAGNFQHIFSRQNYQASEDSIAFVQDAQSVLEIAESSDDHIETLASSSEQRMVNVSDGVGDHEEQMIDDSDDPEEHVSAGHENQASDSLIDAMQTPAVSISREKPSSDVSTDGEKVECDISNSEKQTSASLTDIEQNVSVNSSEREELASGVSTDHQMAVSNNAPHETKTSEVKLQHKRKSSKSKSERKKEKELQSFFV